MIFDPTAMFVHLAKLKAKVMPIMNGDTKQSTHPILAMHESMRESEHGFLRDMLEIYAEKAESVLQFVADGYGMPQALELARYPERSYYETHARVPSFRAKMRAARLEGMSRREFRSNPVGWYLDGELRRAREVRAAA